jgi:hypothetical protein
MPEETLRRGLSRSSYLTRASHEVMEQEGRNPNNLTFKRINLLSYGSAQESIMRLESPNIAQELLKDLEKP